ncbi:T-box protein [Parasponia andersonii]|uniref:T-box protein n=1 Tax=Parasponia andersonii TaxID=3476 RepID=A0A2P5ASG7_PARAD|nr:T-box protein [Parasponia andersonii]
MANSSLSLRFTIIFSLSLSTAYSFSSSSSSSPVFFKPFSLSSRPKAPKATPSDILTLLGDTRRASTVDPSVANELNSCFKFLAPFTPNGLKMVPQSCSHRKSLCFNTNGARTRTEENELIWWPPQSVLDLARFAFDSRQNTEAFHLALDPTVIPVPDVEGSKEDRCQLTRTPYGFRFISEEFNSYLEFLFDLIVARAPAVGLNVSLNRYDFFHGHLFLDTDSGRLGILFHAKEYPAFDKEVFPYNMGYCQKGSNVTYDDSMNLRNILWLAPLPSDSTEAWEASGVLVVLDARPGGIIYRDIVPEYVKFVRTIYEDDFGEVVADVNYLDVGDVSPNYQLFIC